MPKRLTIEGNKTFERINDKRIAPSVKSELFTLYKENETMVKKLLDCIDVGWRTIQDKISLENITLLYPLEQYQVSSYEITEDSKHVGKNRVTIKYIHEESCLTFVALV